MTYKHDCVWEVLRGRGDNEYVCCAVCYRILSIQTLLAAYKELEQLKKDRAKAL